MFAELVEQLINLADDADYLADEDLSPFVRDVLSEFTTPLIGHRGRVLWPVGELAAWL